MTLAERDLFEARTAFALARPHHVMVGTSTQDIARNATVTFTGVPAGQVTVTLGDVATNCELEMGQQNPRTLTVTAGQTVSTTFNVVCDAHVVQALANRTFSPATLRIRVGDTVRWENNSGVSHNVAADDGSFRCSNGCDGEGGNGNPAPSWEFTRTFNAEGTIAYHCDVHGDFGMVGQIIVQSP